MSHVKSEVKVDLLFQSRPRHFPDSNPEVINLTTEKCRCSFKYPNIINPPSRKPLPTNGACCENSLYPSLLHKDFPEENFS